MTQAACAATRLAKIVNIENLVEVTGWQTRAPAAQNGYQCTMNESLKPWERNTPPNGVPKFSRMDRPAVTKEEFVDALTTKLEYSPPLGGPYVSKSAAKLENSEGASLVFDLLAGDKEKLTKHRMSTRLRELSDGEEGITWASFQRIVGAE